MFDDEGQTTYGAFTISSPWDPHRSGELNGVIQGGLNYKARVLHDVA